MLRNERLYAFIASGFILLLFVLGMSDYLLPNGSPFKDYVRGTFTETIGIIVTLVFVEYIFSRHEEKKEIAAEVDSIKRSHKVLNAYMTKYELYAYQVVTPVSNRNSESFGKVPNDFTFNDMRDLFFQSLLMHDGQEPVVLACVKAQKELKRCIEDSLRNINYQHNSQLSNLFLEYLDSLGVIDLFDGISFHCTASMKDGSDRRELKDFIADMIRTHSGPVDYLPNNLINTYITLYNLIKYNIDFIKRYRRAIEAIIGPEAEMMTTSENSHSQSLN